MGKDHTRPILDRNLWEKMKGLAKKKAENYKLSNKQIQMEAVDALEAAVDD